MDEFYQPAERYRHSAVLIGEQLYSWQSDHPDLPMVHSSVEKQRLTSFVDAFQSRLGMWQHHPTAGIPPLGVHGYATCYIGRIIFYFGGWCGHGECDHNSITALNVEDYSWNEIFSTSDNTGPMRKSGSALLAFHDQLLAIGGCGYKAPSNPIPSAKYEKDNLSTYTNEHHIYDRRGAQWTTPTITGDIPPPMGNFTLTQISTEQAVMFGGYGPTGGFSSPLRLATLSRDSVHWQRLAPHGPERPSGRYEHAATCLTPSQLGIQSTILLVVGGWKMNDCWICDVNNVTWKRINNMPHVVAERYDHSISAVAVSDSCIWVMVVGGWLNRRVLYAYPMVALFELRLTPKGHWEFTYIRHNEEIYAGYKERFSQTFPALMSAYVHKLQQQLQGKEQQLQLAQQQSAEKERQVEDLELCLKKSDNELQMVKKISRAKDSELDQVHAQLKASEAAWSELEKMKKFSQGLAFENRKLKQELEESQTPLVKKPPLTCESAVQADYLSATEGPLMEELASTVFEITGGKHQTHKWSRNGFRLTVPAGAVPEGTTISLAVRALLAESFELPENSQLISAIYWVAASEHFKEEVTLYMQHCAAIKSESQCTQFKFVAGKCSQEYLPYLLKMREGGVFTPYSQEASISVKQFSFYAIVHEGDEDTDPCYYGQGFYRRKGQGQSWILDYTITCYIESLVTWVQGKYENRGWTQHHEQLLEFDETTNNNSQPAISLKVKEPADDKQKNWDVSFVSNIRFKKWIVDRITNKDHLPFCRIGIEWMGLPGNIRSSFARKIVLLGMKGPDNYFQIFLPEEAPSAVTSAEGPSSSGRHPSSLSAGFIGGASLFSPPETVLTNPLSDPPTLLDFLESVAAVIPAKWRKVGIALQITSESLDGFYQQYNGDQERCYEAIFHAWRNQGQPLTWEKLLKALRRKHVGECLLAEELSKRLSTNQ